MYDKETTRRMHGTHLDLCSGIGGFALAAQWTGWETTQFSEINPYCCAVLKKHWPQVPNCGDIRNAIGIKGDLVTAGFPCQPFSVAGKRRGKSDDRFIWPSLLEVISRSGATWILLENVPGIISMELDNCISDLEALGYSCAPPLVIPACAIGTDHERERVWIIAHLNCKRELQQSRLVKDERGWTGNGVGSLVTNADSERLQTSWKRSEAASEKKGEPIQPAFATFPRREAYPSLLRSVHGIPRRVDRIRCLGNAIVPQVAAQILGMMAAASE